MKSAIVSGYVYNTVMDVLLLRSWSYSSPMMPRLASPVSSNCFAHALIYPKAFFLTGPAVV